MGLLSWLFRSQPGGADARASSSRSESPGSTTDAYYELLGRIHSYEKVSRYSDMLRCCEESFPLLPDLVDTTIKEYGAFDLTSIPAIEIATTYWAAMGDTESLERVARIVDSVPSLKLGWENVVAQAFDRGALGNRIIDHVRENPGAIQSKLKTILDVSGDDVRDVAYYLQRVGRLRREKAGNSYKLFLM